jgi:hypothetical protein
MIRCTILSKDENHTQNLTHGNPETIKNSNLRSILIDWQSEGRRFDPDQLHEG